jgi:DNA-binding transcriptional ArsR family regulator
MTQSNGDTALSLDELFDILRNARRRHVVELLDEYGGEAEFRELTDAVARRETGAPVSYEERKRVYVSLRQSHLPRLADAGVVEYDRDRGTVRATPRFDTVVRPLEAVTERFETQVGADD